MSARELLSHEPATGALYWRGETGNPDAEVARARSAWGSWAALSLTNRAETLRRFANIVRNRQEDLADCISRETGKPLWETRAEVESVINKVEVSVKAAAERTAQRRMEGALGVKSAVRHKPHGVLAVLGPFNFPAYLPACHIIPALIAGNAIVFKPSEKAPATGVMLVRLLHEAGVPEGVVRVVVGDAAEGQALAANSDIDGLLFTGSARTGLILNRLFADRPGKMLVLEMSGNNPIVVWDTPDIHTAAVLVIQSAFLSAGQRCANARRLIVKDSVNQPLMQEISRIANRLIVGDPHDTPQPFMGPVIDNDTADALQESFMSLMMRGGSPVINLERPSQNLPFLRPAMIDMTNVSDRPDVELFGPILQTVRVSGFEEAIAEANRTRFGLSASLVGGSPAQFDQFWANVRAGVVNWNRPTNGAPANAPFGGLGLSGNHRPTAYYAADYCAYPVVSTEEENGRAVIGIGLKEDAPSFAI